MPRFSGGIIAATILRPSHTGTPSTVYTGVQMQIDPVSPNIPGQGDGRPFFQFDGYTFTGGYDIRVGDIVQDPASTDPVSNQTTAWAVRWDAGQYPDHVELGLTLTTAVGG